MDQAFEGLEGIVSICDDITVHGVNEEDHDQKLHKLYLILPSVTLSSKKLLS